MLAKGKGVRREAESEGLEPVGFPEAKFRADVANYVGAGTAYKADARRTSLLFKIKSKRPGRKRTDSGLLPEPCNVNAAATWNEGYRLLPGEVWTVCESNPYSDV